MGTENSGYQPVQVFSCCQINPTHIKDREFDAQLFSILQFAPKPAVIKMDHFHIGGRLLHFMLLHLLFIYYTCIIITQHCIVIEISLAEEWDIWNS